MVIEIKPGEVGTWSIIRNVAVAVDALLERGSYEVERRSRSERDSQAGNKVWPLQGYCRLFADLSVPDASCRLFCCPSPGVLPDTRRLTM